jgi:predicted porin
MKKTLVILASLSATSIFAQSSVTLYGRADAWLGNVKNCGSAGTPCVSNNVLNSGGYTTSRWGMRGTEDLGNGLKANFNLEGGINIDNGSQRGDLFSRQSWVGLSGGFGDVRFGRTTTPMDDYNEVGSDHVAFDIFANNRPDVRDNLSGEPASRFSNAIKYITPNYGGVRVSAMYGLGEGKTGVPAGAGSRAGDDLSLAVRYSNGPIGVSYAYQLEKNTTSGAPSSKFNSLNAGYDFGSFAVSGAYDFDSTSLGKTRAFSLGASVPVGNFKLGVGINSGKEKVSGVDGKKASGFGIVGQYAFSKRTRLYGGFDEFKVKASTGAQDKKRATLAAGMRHDF